MPAAWHSTAPTLPLCSLCAAAPLPSEAALAAACSSTTALFGEERADLICFGFFCDAGGGGGEVAGFVALHPAPPDAARRRYATLSAAKASGARGPLWLPVGALRNTPLARIMGLVTARVRSFVEPAADFTLLGAVVGAMAPRPVAPASGALPVACVAARLSPDEVKARSARAVSALQREFRLAIAHGGYNESERAYLSTWLAKIEPPEFGDMPRGLLEQAAIPTDPLIRHIPYTQRIAVASPLPRSRRCRHHLGRLPHPPGPQSGVMPSCPRQLPSFAPGSGSCGTHCAVLPRARQVSALLATCPLPWPSA